MLPELGKLYRGQTVIVQLADERVMLNARSHTPEHRRAICISPDGATHWTAPYLDSALFEPVCMGSIVGHSLPLAENPGRLRFG